MRVVRTVAELQAWRAELSVADAVAFVPTMGFLHEGHLALMHEARRRVPAGRGPLVVSIFVNPTQFDDPADLARYPRDEEGDLRKAESAGVDLVFAPTDPWEVFSADSRTWVEVDGLDEVLCGASRIGHFRGVCTVVAKLWNLVRPAVAVFGEKDYQQLAIIRRMHADLYLCGEVVGLSTVRDGDGLAMSSRNSRLSVTARAEALAIPAVLGEVTRRFAGGERGVGGLLRGARERLAAGTIDYVEIVDAETLEAVEVVARPALCALAVAFAGVRLIDNVVLDPRAAS